MIRKAFPLLLVVAGVIGLLGLGLSSVFAQQAGPSRDLPTGPVAQGEKFTVTITDTGYGADREIGQVVETLPAGFSYVDGSATKVVGHATKGVVRGTVDATDSRIVTFSVVSVESFTYEVMVGDSVGDGDHTFSGAGGDDTITVEGGTTTPPDMTASPVATTPPDTTTPGGVSRELPTGPVAQGEKFTVTITDTGYGADREIGQVVETLPAGFSYVDGSATKVVGHATKGVVRGTVDATDSRIVTFSVVSVESFTYEVMVGDSVGDGDHTFSGAGGDDTITVEAGDDTTTPPDTTTPEPTAGLRGSAGPRGGTGSAGPEGDTGPAGPKGDTGPAGPEGDTGYRTCRAQGRYRGYRTCRAQGRYRGYRTCRAQGRYRGYRTCRAQGRYRGYRTCRAQGRYRGYRTCRAQGRYRGYRTCRAQGRYRGYRTCRAQGRYRGYRFQRLGDREFDPLFGSCPGRRRGSLANETAARLSNPDGLSENWGHPAQCRVPPSYWKF